jgi:hypothetical protein
MTRGMMSILPVLIIACTVGSAVILHPITIEMSLLVLVNGLYTGVLVWSLGAVLNWKKGNGG